MPAPAGIGVPTTLVVREQAARQPMRAANLPVAQPRTTLPLAAAAQAAAGPLDGGAQSAPKARLSPPPYMPPPSAPEPASHGVTRQRSEEPAVDIDKIVDKVHRKFLQRLAIEGERRGVR